MMNTEKFVQNWLKLSNELLSKTDNNTQNAAVFPSSELSTISHCIFDSLECNMSEQIMTEVCNRLVSMFRSKNRTMHLSVLEFIPSLIWSYLSKISSSKAKSRSLEACLLTLYNLSISNTESSKEPTYLTIPPIGRPSLYHEPSCLGSQTLTEFALSRYDQGDRKLPIGPSPQIDKINAKNRLSVISHLLKCYFKDIALLTKKSHKYLCNLAIRACCTGFNSYLTRHVLSCSDELLSKPRIALSPELLCDFVNSIYFIMFNGHPELGLEALESIHQRANYELYSNVLLLTNAVKNSLEHNPSGQPHDGPMGVSIAITPACILNNLNKEAITNASFRTKKLPDDITPEVEAEQTSDSEENKNTSTSTEKQHKILSGIKLGGPLKSAIKKVERSITLKKTVQETKDSNSSPAKIDKPDGKFTGSNVVGKSDKMGAVGNHDTPVELKDLEQDNQQDHQDCKIDESPENLLIDSHHGLNHENIEIIVEPPPREDADNITTKL